MYSFQWLSNIHCLYIPQLSYPLICQWTSRSLPCPSYCKQCCNEHWGMLVSIFIFIFYPHSEDNGLPFWKSRVPWWCLEDVLWELFHVQMIFLNIFMEEKVNSLSYPYAIFRTSPLDIAFSLQPPLFLDGFISLITPHFAANEVNFFQK